MSRPHVVGSSTGSNGLYIRHHTIPSHSATASHLAIAEWLLAKETGAESAVPEGAEVARRVCEKLNQRVAELITPTASEALLSRAIHLTRSDFPFLGCGHPGHTPEAFIVCLAESAAAVESNLALEGFAALFGTLIGLLALFISEDLTFRLLRGIWPELPIAASIGATAATNVEATNSALGKKAS
jgi:hypothetical protein